MKILPQIFVLGYICMISCNVILADTSQKPTNIPLKNLGKCIISHSFTRATCENINSPDIPQDLPRTIRGLNLVNCSFKYLQKSSFIKYSGLLRLSIQNCKIDKVEGDFLQETSELVELEITEKTVLPSIEEIELPPALNYVNIFSMSLGNFKLFHLSNLEVLNASNNKFQIFPTLDHKAPITYLTFDENPALVLYAEDIIPFCRLHTLQANLAVQKKPCDCFRLMHWLKNQSISHNLKSNLCSNKTAQNCSFKYNDELLKLREECKLNAPKPINATAKPSDSKMWLAYGLLVIFGSAALVYFARARRNQQFEDQINEINRAREIQPETPTIPVKQEHERKLKNHSTETPTII